MRTLFHFTVVALLLVCLSYGAIPQGKNIKTSAKQLNRLERFLIRTLHPEIPLDKILEQENLTNEGGDNGIQDEYEGTLEFMQVEVPLFFLQLNKMGDDIMLPTFQYEYGWWFCYMGYCSGFNTIYDFRKPIMKNVTSTTLVGSMNGSQLTVDFKIPDVEIHMPEFTLEDTNYGQDPPATSETTFWRGGTTIVKNYSMTLTTNITMGLQGLRASDVNLDLSVDFLGYRYENGTHTFPDGREEEWGSVETIYHESLMESWNDGGKEDIQEMVEHWLNCFLSNGRGESSCNRILESSLHRQSFAELVHSFGLNGLNKARAAENMS